MISFCDANIIHYLYSIILIHFSIVIFDYLKDNNVLLSLSFHRVPVRKINDKVITYYEPTRYTKKNDEKRNKRSAAGAVPRAVLRQ